MNRCRWVNNKNSLYIKYHDEEWGVINNDDSYLFEMIVLESFHCGLSFEIILNKRESFRDAFDNFDYHKISKYNNEKVEELMNNKDIVRSIAKIKATIDNANSFIKVQEEFGSFSNYIYSLSNTIYNEYLTKSTLSDKVSKELKKRGFKFLGSVTTYSYLEAIGVINNHHIECYKHIDNN